MFDLISIGDVTEDVFVRVDEAASVHKTADHKYHLDFKFGTKLAIERVDKLIGGNAGNLAIGASRLGLRSALYAEVGKDDQGRKLRHALKENNVATTYFYLKKGQKTNYSVVLYYHAERTILVHHEPRKYQFPSLAKARYVYLTSMGQGSEKIFSPLLHYLEKTNAELGFNPGTHQINLGIQKLTPFLKKTTVLFVNTEEAQELLHSQKRDFPFLLESLYRCGPKTVVITDGPDGSYAYAGKDHWYCPIYDVPVIERTGCGDAYSTGFLSALLYKHDIQEAMRWGTLNAASVLQKIGPQEGLMYLLIMRKILKAHPKFFPRTFSSAEVVKDKVYQSKTAMRF